MKRRSFVLGTIAAMFAPVAGLLAKPPRKRFRELYVADTAKGGGDGSAENPLTMQEARERHGFIRDRTFGAEDVVIDNNVFINCRFSGTNLVSHNERAEMFMGCQFDGHSWNGEHRVGIKRDMAHSFVNCVTFNSPVGYEAAWQQNLYA